MSLFKWKVILCFATSCRPSPRSCNLCAEFSDFDCTKLHSMKQCLKRLGQLLQSVAAGPVENELAQVTFPAAYAVADLSLAWLAANAGLKLSSIDIEVLQMVAQGLLHFCLHYFCYDELLQTVDALFIVLAEAPALIVPSLPEEDVTRLFVTMGRSMGHMAGGAMSERTQISTMLLMAVIASVDCPVTACVSGMLDGGLSPFGGLTKPKSQPPPMLGFAAFMQCLHCENIILAQEHTAMHGLCAMMAVRWRLHQWQLLRRLALACGIHVSTALGKDDAFRTEHSREQCIEFANDLYMQLWIEEPDASAETGAVEWDTPATRKWRRFAALSIQAANCGIWANNDPTDAHFDERKEQQAPFNLPVPAEATGELLAALQAPLWLDRRRMVLHRSIQEQS